MGQVGRFRVTEVRETHQSGERLSSLEPTGSLGKGRGRAARSKTSWPGRATCFGVTGKEDFIITI